MQCLSYYTNSALTGSLASTAADAAWGGTNDLIVEAIGTRGLMEVTEGHPDRTKVRRAVKVDPNPPPGQEGAGAGRFMELTKGLSRTQVVDAIKMGLKLGHRQYCLSNLWTRD